MSSTEKHSYISINELDNTSIPTDPNNSVQWGKDYERRFIELNPHLFKGNDIPLIDGGYSALIPQTRRGV